MNIITIILVLTILIANLTAVMWAICYFYKKSHYFKTPIQHGIYSLAALVLMTFAISLFRLLQGVQTRAVKYMHAFLHVIICCLMYFSLLNLEDPEWHYLHGFPAFVVYYCYIGQIAFGLLLFLAFPKGDLRDALSLVHNIIGVWLYNCYVGVAITGWHNCSSSYKGGYVHETSESGVESRGCIIILDYYKSLLIFGAILINFLLLLPVYQWELVGPL